MPKTVNTAFDTFLRDYVNLCPDETHKARGSRNWLISQIHQFPDKNSSFPKLYSEQDIFFGSFARRTKKRILDDIDIMIALHADSGYYQEFSNHVEIYIGDSSSRLQALCFDGTNRLSSRKVINNFVGMLNQVPQYEEAHIKRNMEAATLNLKSYPWVFDIVPCFFTTKNYLNRDYYVIPDGQGNWKMTDPRIDANLVTEVNQRNNGNVLNVIRLMKYWNKRPTMPSMSSYLIENMILNLYAQSSETASQYVDLEVSVVLQNIRYSVFYPVNDPKGIQGNINSLSYEEQEKIAKRADLDFGKACEAIALEKNNDHKLAIEKWREIFGLDFPIYD